MSILGLDISSTRTGWVVMDFDGTLLKFGTICPPKTMTLAEKLRMFRQNLLEIFQEHKPTKVIIEDVFIRHVRSAVVLARFSGVAIETFSELAPSLITATSARRIVGQFVGKDVRDKKAAFELVKDKYSLNDFIFSKHNDVTDAILLGLAIIYGQAGGKTESTARPKKSNGRKVQKTTEKKRKGRKKK